MGEKKKKHTITNILNELPGNRWLYWTNTIWETSYPPDETHKLRKAHGAIKPPEVMKEIVEFFTKPGELVLDPFAGVGGTLLGAELCGRRAIGIELNPLWIKIYEDIRRKFIVHEGILAKRHIMDETEQEKNREISAIIMKGDCLSLLESFKSSCIDAVICDPPYGINHKPTGFKNETNFNMFNLLEKKDLGNLSSFEDFLEAMAIFGEKIHRILKPQKYLVLLIGDRYQNGEYFPLGIKTAYALRNSGFEFKGLKIWWNKVTQRPLKPYSVKKVFVPNITHQNIIIMRKRKE